MGLTEADVVPGQLVRHSTGWTGTLNRLGTPGVAEVIPDGGSGPRWFYLDQFDAVTWDGGNLPARVPITSWDGGGVVKPSWTMVPPVSASDLDRRYLTDPGFHQLVAYQRQLLQLASYQDLRDAADMAIRIETDRRKRAAGDTCGKGQTDAQEERGDHGTGQP